MPGILALATCHLRYANKIFLVCWLWLHVPLDTPTKYVGGDRAGLESYLVERKRRKEEREAEKEDRVKEDKRKKDKKDKDRKMKPDKNAEKKVTNP